MDTSVRITWLGHACFMIEKDNYCVIFDPYQDGSVPGLEDMRESANLVLCSHGHFDHCGVECVTKLSDAMSPFEVTRLETFHDHHEGAKRGANVMHILQAGDLRIAHLGDLGCTPTDEQMQQLKGVDVMMIPVGGFYTIDGAEAAKIVKASEPKLVLPMHYRSEEDGFGYDNIETVDAFLDAMDEDAAIIDDCILELDEQLGARIVLLTPQNLETGFVTFMITGKDGQEHEMAVMDEFDFENDHYVVAAEVKEDTIDEDGLYIYRSVMNGDDFTVEEIKKQFDYNRIAKAYMEME